MKKSGFTLAEVLITLGIIGVVAAMTIPSLINQTNNADIKAALKKGLSVTNQAILMNIAIEGNDFAALSNAGTGTTGSIANMITSRMNVASSTTGTINTLGSLGAAAGTNTNYTFFLNDGMAISIPNTMGTGGTTCTVTGNTGACTMAIDVNGLKGPNKYTQLATPTSTSGIFDQYSFTFGNQSVFPATNQARNVLNHQ